MNRFLGFLLMAVLAVGLVGCRSRLTFPQGGPYQSGYRVQEGVIVAFPDDILERTYRVKVGGFLDGTTFIVPLIDAYKIETVNRMNGLFTRGVTVTSHSMLQQVEEREERDTRRREEADAPESTDTKNARELDRVLGELAAKERGEKVEATEAELAREAMREANLEAIRDKGAPYLLYFKDALLIFEEQRCLVSFSVQLRDRRTKNILFERRYQGRSAPFKPRDNTRTNEMLLVGVTKQALAGPMQQLTQDVAESLAADPVQPRGGR